MSDEWYRAWRANELRRGPSFTASRTRDAVLAIGGLVVLMILLAPLIRLV